MRPVASFKPAVFLFALTVQFAWSVPLQAANIRVNTLSDVVNGADGSCSLREAIVAANTNAASGAVAGECAAGAAFPNPDVIRFRLITGFIVPTAGNGPLPDVTEGALTIDGWARPAQARTADPASASMVRCLARTAA